MKFISIAFGAYASAALFSCSEPGNLTHQSMRAAVAETPAFSGVAAVAIDGEVTYSVAKGVANQETGELVTFDTRFNVGSAGKFLTMLAIAKMRNAQQLSLDDALITYIPELSPNVTADVKLRHLLAHKSGFPEVFALDEALLVTAEDNHDYFEIILNAGYSANPTEEEQYRNTNFMILGEVIERVSSRPYEDYMKSEILDPTGMNGFDFARAEDPNRPGNALGYLAMDLETWMNTPGSGASDNISDYKHIPRKIRPNRMANAAGGSFATAQDFVELARALQDASIISHETLDEFCDPITVYRDESPVYLSGYGMGCSIRVYDGVRQIGHGGGGPGVNARFDYFPELGAVIIVLTNHDELASPVASALGEIIRLQ